MLGWARSLVKMLKLGLALELWLVMILKPRSGFRPGLPPGIECCWVEVGHGMGVGEC